MSDDIGFILAQRGETHGNYSCVSRCYAEMLRSFLKAKKRKLNNMEINHVIDFDEMLPEKTYTIHAIMMKLARIACGDSDHIDHWRDIEGYARLVREHLERNANEQ